MCVLLPPAALSPSVYVQSQRGRGGPWQVEDPPHKFHRGGTFSALFGFQLTKSMSTLVPLVCTSENRGPDGPESCPVDTGPGHPRPREVLDPGP